ncbi:Fe(3+)-hydroxamate ABC transporter permease FhuB [Vibrio sp. SCSIO 43140]|uniref:Fe(3+)-hydroxamate ABC transporter permease FhuB n=1 Tax=Vibrio sp. SCSIO 43140 TaxID=2819100 RepID=UPI002074B8D3|nr:Fe(3+)-hydroxamate ABC transporter permease FhuB [Vibrio sp. SCSIO 43140]USD63289.1 Fe(3+)-hydroxamate ABC transporter permease FhuB [Vibrio sp. SCSIO 43140]
MQLTAHRGAAPFGKMALFVFISALVLVWLFQNAVPYHLSFSEWRTYFLSRDDSDYRQLILHFTFFPRLSMALLCGAALAIAGCLMQHLLQNPLASPTTLGVAAGAELGMTASLFAGVVGGSLIQYAYAFGGGMLAASLVFLLTAKRGFAPLQMVLAGMVVTLFLGATNMMLVMLNEQQLTSLFVWGAGALAQQGWENAHLLFWVLAVVLGLVMVMLRPLSALELGSEVAESAGVNVARVRAFGLGLSVVITSVVVATVGVIGFVGLVAPTIAKMLGARKFAQRVLLSGVVGALLLLTADLIIQPFSGVSSELLPTGAMTALFGAPCLLWLLTKKKFASSFKAEEVANKVYHPKSFALVSLILALLLVVVTALAVLLGRTQVGWGFSGDLSILDLRMPRVLGAIFAGCGLALAGTMVQRITVNPMASPEVMGISSGAALALVLCAWFGFTPTRIEQIVYGGVGAALVMIVILQFSKRSNYAPSQLLLTGIAVSAGLDAVLRVALSSGQDNVQALLTWLSGSTYLASYNDVFALGLGIVVFGGATYAASRWLDILNLGQVSAVSVGVNTKQTRLFLLVIASLLTALSTLVIGPLSFVGLLAPHIARALGQYKAKNQLVVACLVGSILMVSADWLGRTIWFPWQFPAGLMASVIGGAYFLILLRKGS